MFNNIFETYYNNSEVLNLKVPASDFFFSYDSLNNENAKDLVNNYFTVKSKEGIPSLRSIVYDDDTNMVNIIVTVDYKKSLINRSYEVPDLMSMSEYNG